MNKDQAQNVDAAFEKVFEALFRCWSYVHLIRGLQAGARANKQRRDQNLLAIDTIYRGVFDALFSAFGTVIDNTKKTYSLPSIISLIKKYTAQDHPIRWELKKVEKALNAEEDGPLSRMRNWRHKVVAHHTKEGRSEEFYPENKLYLDEVEALLQEVESLANSISVPLIKKGTECRSGAEKDLKNQGERLINA